LLYNDGTDSWVQSLNGHVKVWPKNSGASNALLSVYRGDGTTVEFQVILGQRALLLSGWQAGGAGGVYTASYNASNQLTLGSGSVIAWNSGATGAGSLDSGLARNAAGQVRVSNASTGFGQLTAGTSDSATNTKPAALIADHASSGTPAAGFGSTVSLKAQDSTTASQDLAAVQGEWVVATHASRTARLTFVTMDSAGTREGLRIESTGSAAAIGFLGAAAVTRPNVTGSRGGNAALASLLTALANLGLITDSTSA
jgi:hypothetical protein